MGRLTADASIGVDANVLPNSQLVSRSGASGGGQLAPLGEEDIDGARFCSSHSFRVPRLCHRCNWLLAHKVQPKRDQQPSAFDPRYVLLELVGMESVYGLIEHISSLLLLSPP